MASSFLAVVGVLASLMGICATIEWDMYNEQGSSTTVGWCFTATIVLFIALWFRGC